MEQELEMERRDIYREAMQDISASKNTSATVCDHLICCVWTGTVAEQELGDLTVLLLGKTDENCITILHTRIAKKVMIEKARIKHIPKTG